MIHPDDNTKLDLLDRHLYCRQQHAVEIIQLTEVPPPTPRFTSAHVDSSSTSSSYSCDSESDYPSDEDDDDDDSESDYGTSYCSSDTPEEMDDEEDVASTHDETYDTRVTRIHAWREKYAKDMGLTPPESLPVDSTKRKAPDEYEIGEDTESRSSKRSRSNHAHSASTLTTHICAACDASFSTRQHLRQHGQAEHANEACRIAVDYDFE